MSTTASEHVASEFPEPAQQFPVGDVTLAWDRWGGGAAGELVLCHGFTGSAHDFALQIPTLADERPVLALDHRGHGRSTKLGRLDGYGIDLLTADLVALLDREASGPVHLLGHSMGGRVALGVVLARPDLVRSLILMDTTAWTFAPQPAELADAIAGFMAKFDPERGLPDLGDMAGPEDELITAATPEAWRRRKDELSAGVDPYAFKVLGTQLFDETLAVGDRLGEIRCPTTVLVGANDHPLVDAAPAMVSAVEGAHLVEIEGAFHSPQLTHAGPWSEALREHLAWAEGGR